jgi:hypothetical protein
MESVKDFDLSEGSCPEAMAQSIFKDILRRRVEAS